MWRSKFLYILISSIYMGESDDLQKEWWEAVSNFNWLPNVTWTNPAEFPPPFIRTIPETRFGSYIE